MDYSYASTDDRGVIEDYLAINTMTGDVWDVWDCKRITNPKLRKAQAEIRDGFKETERSQYDWLHQLRPECRYE